MENILLEEINRMRRLMNLMEVEDIETEDTLDNDPLRDTIIKSLKQQLGGGKEIYVRLVDNRPGKEGKSNIVKMVNGEVIDIDDDQPEPVSEGIKDTLKIGAICLILASGMISCTKEDSLEPNKIENSLESNVDFLNTQGLNVPFEVIAKTMFPQKMKYAKDRDRQTPTLSMGKIDSAVNNQNEPWCGYWKFTDPCRYDNGQVLIWTNPTDSEPYGSIWSGYQTVTPRVDSSWNGFHLLKGKKYLIDKYTIHSFKHDKVKAHVSITMSNPNTDRGKLFPLEIDYSGKTMRITNWGGGNAVEVGGFDGFDFKW